MLARMQQKSKTLAFSLLLALNFILIISLSSLEHYKNTNLHKQELADYLNHLTIKINKTDMIVNELSEYLFEKESARNYIHSLLENIGAIGIFRILDDNYSSTIIGHEDLSKFNYKSRPWFNEPAGISTPFMGQITKKMEFRIQRRR